jgi:hypothetical protein
MIMIPMTRTAYLLTMLACLATLSIVAGCTSTRPIVNHWIHAHEEDSSGIEVYRPKGYPFGPSRGREGYDLRGDGMAIIESIAPADGIAADTGRWVLSDEMMLTITSGDGRPRRYDVAYVDSALLKLRVMR